MANWLFELFEGKIQDELARNRLHGAIEEYLEREKTIFESCSQEGEIDYEGLTQYLRDTMPSEIETRIFASSSEERGRARSELYAKAVSYARVKTTLQEKNVRKYVNDVLWIVRDFYEKQVPPLQRYMRTAIVEDILKESRKQNKEQTQEIIERVGQMIKTESGSSTWFIENNAALIRAGNYEQVEANFQLLYQGISTEHALAPDYGFGQRKVGGKERLVSVPLTEDAERLYPPLYKIKGRLFVGEKMATDLTPELVQYADNHQLPITIAIDEVNKCLGKIVDPIQVEAEELCGQKWIRLPKPFPEAQAYRILIDGVSACENVYLRVIEKNEDGSVVYSNQENPYPFSIRFTVDPAREYTEFAFSYKGTDHSSYLQYYEFLKKIHGSKLISFCDVSTGKPMLEVNNQPSKDEMYEAKTDRHIAFLKKLIIIEQFFGISIALPEECPHDDMCRVLYLADLIEGKVQREWQRCEIPLCIGAGTKNKLKEAGEKASSYTEVTTMTINVFGHEITCPFVRILKCAKLENKEKTLKKVEACETGDTIRIAFVPEGPDGNEVYEYVLKDDKGEWETNLQKLRKDLI